MQVQSSELSYRPSKANHSSLRYSRVFPLNGVSSLTLQQSSPTEVQYEVPNKVLNYGASGLDFDLTVAAGGAGVVNSLHTCGHVMLDRVELRTREGVRLVDVNYYSDYSRATLPYLTKHDQFMSDAASRGGLTPALASIVGKGSNLFKCDAAAGTTPVPSSGKAGYRINSGGSALEAVANSYTSPNYVTSSGANAAMTISYHIPFDEIRQSLLALDKTTYWGQSLILVFHYSPVNKIGWQSDNTLVATPTPITAAVTVTNMRVMLAVETSSRIVESLVQTVQQRGMQLMVPYVWSYLQPSGATTDSNFNLRINSGFGQRLTSVFSAVANNTPTGITAVDINNGLAANTKVEELQTALDNTPLQEYRIQCNKNEDFEIMEPMLKGCVINGVSCYRHNRVFIDSWREGPSCDYHMNDNAMIADGLDLSSDRTYAVNYTKPAVDQRHFYWLACQRTVNIQSNGQIQIS